VNIHEDQQSRGPEHWAARWPRPRALVAGGHKVSARTCRFAKWPAICSFALVMAGQVAYHLMAQAEIARAPWAITAVVSSSPRA
jgi:hypothetical protein